MLTSLYTAAAGMDAAEALHAVTSRNLAHAHQPGFRRTMAVDSSFTPQVEGSDASAATPLPRSEFRIDFSAGAMERTERPLDVALNGQGFFVVEGPGGPLYTRNGAFQLSPEGNIVTADGLRVLGTGGPLVLPPGASLSNLRVAADGTLQAGEIPIGQLKVVQFDDLSRLEPAGVTLFRAPADLQPTPAAATVVQGVREHSNTQPVEELVALITASRRYEAAQRAMRTIADAVQRHTDMQGRS